jgi:hypothetical protein
MESPHESYADARDNKEVCMITAIVTVVDIGTSGDRLAATEVDVDALEETLGLLVVLVVAFV